MDVLKAGHCTGGKRSADVLLRSLYYTLAGSPGARVGGPLGGLWAELG